MQRSVETKALSFYLLGPNERKPQCFAELLLINSGAPVIIKGAFREKGSPNVLLWEIHYATFLG